MKAHDVMSVDIVAATENATAIEVATRMALGIFNGMPVLDKSGRLVGQITTIDILKLIRKGQDLSTILAKEIMTPDPVTVHEYVSVEDVIDLMDKFGVMMIPVVDKKDGRLIGVCSRYDILKEILNQKFVTIGRTRTATTTIGET
jgi:CBS domain-containing protein